MNEDAIYHSFANHELTLLDAIEALRKIGYTLADAKETVNEWADALSEKDKGKEETP